MLTIGRRYLNFWPVFWALFLLVIQVVTNLWLPTITADIINKGIGQSDMKYIWFMGLIMLIVALASWISARFRCSSAPSPWALWPGWCASS